MRSKFWWLTGFCNSHDVSHFAAFFIVVGAKTSVAESGLSFRTRRNAHISEEKWYLNQFAFKWNSPSLIPLQRSDKTKVPKHKVLKPVKHLHGKPSPKIFNSRDAKSADYSGFPEHSAQFVFFLFVVMILPQVHLRKPCYDFTFL